MDNSSSPRLAEALFGKTRRALLGLLFARPERAWHLRELARQAGVSPTMLSKEASLLVAAGILSEQADGNRRLFRANRDCPIFSELCGIARKTSGLADVLREALAGLAGVSCAFVFGSVARGEERAESDIDVCVIGSVAYRPLAAALAGAEETLGRPVNPVLYSPAEFQEKAAANNPFVMAMLSSPRIFLSGDDHELARATTQSGADRPA